MAVSASGAVRLRTALTPATWRRVPSVARPSVLAWTTGLLYSVNGVLLLAIIGLIGYPLRPGRTGTACGIGVVLIVVGLLTLWLGRRLPRRGYHVLVALGTAIVTALVLVSQPGAAATGVGAAYVFVILDASFFFSWRGMASHVVAVETVAAISLASADTPAGVVVVLEACLFGVAVVAAWLARIADAAEQDPLTLLLNRRGFTRALERALARTAREHGRLALVLLDLDHFQEVNDLAGDRAGDRLLLDCATRWRRALPKDAELARYGGDEFALLLPDTPLGRAADLADFLRTLTPGGRRVSAGVAAWERGDSPSMLTGRVEVALYDAKSAGRDQTVVYGDPGRAASELEAAIDNGELVLHYQPVVRLHDGAVVSREALVRWLHPRRGLVPPGEFVPQAERTGAIHSLGAWTLQHAGYAAARWNATPAVSVSAPTVSVSVNVSVSELRRPDYLDLLRTAIAQSGLAPEQLVVEVTEAVFDADDLQVTASLQAIRALGVRIAIDDFGTGYSSFRWLDRFPLDIVKIDASFVRSITDAGGRTPVLEAMVAMGQALGLTVIAEGVETEQQAAVLRELGCELAQGYLFGRPEPVGA